MIEWFISFQVFRCFLLAIYLTVSWPATHLRIKCAPFPFHHGKNHISCLDAWLSFHSHVWSIPEISIFNAANVKQGETEREGKRGKEEKTQRPRKRWQRKRDKGERNQQWYSWTGCEAVSMRGWGGREGGRRRRKMSRPTSNEGPCGNYS